MKSSEKNQEACVENHSTTVPQPVDNFSSKAPAGDKNPQKCVAGPAESGVKADKAGTQTPAEGSSGPANATNPEAANAADQQTDIPAGRGANAETGNCSGSSSTEPAQTAPSATDAIPREEVRKLVEEAYLKGRNEAIDKLMKQPAILQPLKPKARPVSDEPEVMILNNPRTSIWDR